MSVQDKFLEWVAREYGEELAQRMEPRVKALPQENWFQALYAEVNCLLADEIDALAALLHTKSGGVFPECGKVTREDIEALALL